MSASPVPQSHLAILKAFQQEMRALQEEGTEFAAEYPEAARLLDLEQVDDRDPYVERLTEGFAFLTARIRQATEAEEDGLTGHLLELLMGELEHPLPSVGVVEFHPARLREGSSIVPGGGEVRAKGQAGGTCRFVLSQDVEVFPLAIREARVEVGDQGAARLELCLQSIATKVEAWPHSLPLFLNGDAPIVWTLRYGLSRRAARIEIKEGNGPWRDAPEGLRFERLDGPGYTGDESMVPPLADARDFLCADERFRFLRLVGLDLVGPTAEKLVRIRVHFQGAFPRGMHRAIGADQFRLHAATVVNRFVESCETLVWDHTKSELTLRAWGSDQGEILDVIQVDALTQATPPQRVHFRRFSAYRHAESGHRYFQIHHRHDVHGRPLASLSLGHPDPSHPYQEEFVAATAICCDGNEPHDRIQPRMMNLMHPKLPDALDVTGLTRPSPIHRPPPQVEPLTRLLAFAAGHFQGLLDAGRMRDALRQFLWDPAEAKRTVVDTLQEITTESTHRFKMGIARPELHVKIRLRDTTCTPDTWERLGVLDAFGSVLFRILADQTPIGAHSRMTVVVEPAGTTLEYSK